MRLAEKRDGMIDDSTPETTEPAANTDRPKAPPAASLTAQLIQRVQDESQARRAEPAPSVVIPGAARRPVKPAVIEHQATPQPIEHRSSAPAGNSDATAVWPDEPVGARAQQAILEQAFAEPEPVTAAPPIERSEFQSARDSAATWRSRNGPPVGFWERVIKDVSIFTIVFALLVFAILQTM